MLNPAPKNVGGRVPKPSLILTLSPQGCDKGKGLYRWPETTNIYNNPDFTGHVIDEETSSKISAFADDTAVHMGSIEDITIYQETLGDYSAATGGITNSQPVKA